MAPPKKDFCDRGHLRSPENLHGRSCKECRRTVSGPRSDKKRQAAKIKYQQTPKQKEYRHNYYINKKDWFKDYSRRLRYGLIPGQYEELLKQQNYRCKICFVLNTETPKGLVVDHNHQTNQIRGLLCNICNSHIVHVVETYPHLLEATKSYLENC